MTNRNAGKREETVPWMPARVLERLNGEPRVEPGSEMFLWRGKWEYRVVSVGSVWEGELRRSDSCSVWLFWRLLGGE